MPASSCRMTSFFPTMIADSDISTSRQRASISVTFISSLHLSNDPVEQALDRPIRRPSVKPTALRRSRYFLLPMRARQGEQPRPKVFVEVGSALMSVGQLLAQFDEPWIELLNHRLGLERFLEGGCGIPSRIASEVLP